MENKTAPGQSTVQQTAAFSVFSLRGGVGKTTVAVNLAAALTALWRAKIGLVDLALNTAHCGLMLDLQPRATLASLADWQGPVTAELVNELTAEHSSGVALLTAADIPSEGELVRAEFINQVWPVLSARYPLLVVDGGSQINDVSLAALDRSAYILLVFSPELASVKSTTDALQLFAEFGYPPAKVIPVANWTFPSNPVLLQRIVTTLKVTLGGEIPYDSQGFAQAINSGNPIVLARPDAGAADAFFRLAYRISSSAMETRGAAVEPPTLRKYRRS